MVVRLVPDEVEDDATCHFAMLEPVEDVVDRRQRLQLDISFDLAFGSECQTFGQSTNPSSDHSHSYSKCGLAT